MTAQELETVASYVKDQLADRLERSPAPLPSDYFRLGERLLRVEEAIKNQSVLMESASRRWTNASRPWINASKI